MTVYFAPHFDDYLFPIQSEKFLSNFQCCNLFVLEYTEPWITQEADKETQYNKLSNGEISSVPSKFGPLSPFAKELQTRLRGSGKRVVLERNTTTQAALSLPSDLVNSLVSQGLDKTLEQYKKEIMGLANSIAQRNRGLVNDILQPQLKNGTRGFMFCGSAHFRDLSALLQTSFPTAKVLRFQDSPSLTDRVIGALSVGEQVQDVDFLRLLDSDLSKHGSDYQSFMRAQSDAESLDEQTLRAKYSC